MNCKPGDLAVFVKAHNQENNGLIVRVERWVQAEERYSARYYAGRAGWLVVSEGRPMKCVLHDGEVVYTQGAVALDYMLKPLRDSDGEDEMLRIAGKPKEKETT